MHYCKKNKSLLIWFFCNLVNSIHNFFIILWWLQIWKFRPCYRKINFNRPKFIIQLLIDFFIFIILIPIKILQSLKEIIHFIFSFICFFLIFDCLLITAFIINTRRFYFLNETLMTICTFYSLSLLRIHSIPIILKMWVLLSIRILCHFKISMISSIRSLTSSRNYSSRSLKPWRSHNSIFILPNLSKSKNLIFRSKILRSRVILWHFSLLLFILYWFLLVLLI
jgi:hypothetical protein